MLKKVTFLIISQLIIFHIGALNKMQLSLNSAIELANDSSIAAFQAQNFFLASFWDYANFEASGKPTLRLNTSPISYNRAINKQFNTVDSSYSYFGQHFLSSSIGLNLNQNIALTGGSLSVNSDLNRLQNFGSQASTQYSSSPIWIGLNQPLFAYNSFKWEKKLAPLKYEKAKKEFLTSYEENASIVVGFFFNLATAEQNFKIAETNFANADTLYEIGKKRFEITAITKIDLLNLRLELLNSKDQMSVAENDLSHARSQFLSFLGLNKDTPLELILPEELPNLIINASKAVELATSNNPDVAGFLQKELETNRDMEKVKRENLPTVSLNASYGLNKTSDKMADTYKNLKRQECINLNLSVPLIDWGLRKGRYNLVCKQREAQIASIKQDKIDFEEVVVREIAVFNIQKSLVQSAKEASNVANEAFEISKIKFLIGQVDVNNLIIQLDRKDSTLRNYITALQAYWTAYYAVRRLTLFDFERNKTLAIDFNRYK